MDETIRAKVVSRSLRAPDRNHKTTRVFPQKRNRDCRPLVSVNHTDNETDRQTPKHLPPPDQHTPSAELQIKHIQSARGLVTLKHTHTDAHRNTEKHTETQTHTHTLQTPSVTPDCCRVSTKNNHAAPFVALLPLCGRNTCQDLHRGEIAESQGLITLSWLLLHIYCLLCASNFLRELCF